MYLSDEETRAIDAHIGRLEARTGVQVVTAVVGKSDTYAEIPWQAFALGTGVGGLVVVLADATRPQWITEHTALVCATIVLGAGAACALAAVFVPRFARIFLRADRRELEVRQYAQSLFLTHELFRTAARNGVLVLVSLFERRVEILPDIGLSPRVAEEAWRAVIGRMTPRLRIARPFDALDDGLTALEELLVAKGFEPRAGLNELPDQPIEERGV